MLCRSLLSIVTIHDVVVVWVRCCGKADSGGANFKMK